jgi:hypothetical protein
MAEHGVNVGHCIQLHHTATLMHGPHHQWSSWDRAPSHSMDREDGFSLSKSWKPVICSLKEQDSNVSSDPVGPLWLLFSFHYLCSLIPSRHAWNSVTWPLSRTYLFPTQHILTLSRIPSKLPLFGAVLNSCSFLLLVHPVVRWEPSSFILSHGEPIGTEAHCSTSILFPI